MAVNPYELYKQQDVLSAGRGDLLLMLYDGCIKQLRLASMHITDNEVEGAHVALVKAQAILGRLADDLDMSYEISENLAQLYDFFIRELTEANLRKDPEKIAPVLNMMVDLRAAWQEALQSLKHGSAQRQ